MYTYLKALPFILIQLIVIASLSYYELSFKTILLTCSLVLMISLWTREEIPLWKPSLIPILVLAPLGFLSFKKVLLHYFSPTTFLFFGGMVLAKLIEHHNIHQLFFQKFISYFERSRFLVLAGILLVSIILSSFISNTAAALLMLPLIVHTKSPSLLLATGYGVSLGGLATLTSSPPNAILANFWNTNIATLQPEITITFIKWIKWTSPLIILGFLVLFIVLSISLSRENEFYLERLKIKNNSLNFFQKLTIAIFLFFILGWAGSSYFSFLPSEANWSLIMAIIVITFPIRKESSRLFPLKKLTELNYGILFLFGAGLAFADAIASSELIDLIKNNLSSLVNLSLELKMFLVVLAMIFFTEISSNTAAAAIFIPIFYQLHMPLGLPALPSVLAVTAASSLSFMLPSATPPNAIIFSSKLIRLGQMLRVGFVLNILFALLITYWSLCIY